MFGKFPDRIEFFGGPYDGHVESLAKKTKQLPDSMVCHVSKNALLAVNGQAPMRHNRVTSVAVYDLSRRERAWAYIFVGAVAPQHVFLESHGE